MNSSVETKQETLLLQGWVREMAANCSHKSSQQERERDGAAAGRTTQSNSYQRSWTAGWRSWSSASAPSGRLPRGWTDSDRILLGHLLRNKALVTPQPSQHLARCLGLTTDARTPDEGKCKSAGKACCTGQHSAYKRLGNREDNRKVLCQALITNSTIQCLN